VIQFEPIRHDAGIRRWGRKRYARSLRCEISGTDSYWPAFAADSANRPKQGKVPAWPEHRNTIVKKRGAAARWRPASLIPKRGQIFSTWRGSMKSLRLRRKPKQTDHRAPANTHRASAPGQFEPRQSGWDWRASSPSLQKSATTVDRHRSRARPSAFRDRSRHKGSSGADRPGIPIRAMTSRRDGHYPHEKDGYSMRPMLFCCRPKLLPSEKL